VMDATKSDVNALAREGKTVLEKRKWAVREEHLARKRVEEAEARKSGYSKRKTHVDSSGVARLEKVQECVATISVIASERRSVDGGDDPLKDFAESFGALLSFKEEYRTMGLDEVIVGAIAQNVSPLTRSRERLGAELKYRQNKLLRSGNH
jgi:tuftelin-interacting protein 11